MRFTSGQVFQPLDDGGKLIQGGQLRLTWELMWRLTWSLFTRSTSGQIFQLFQHMGKIIQGVPDAVQVKGA